MDPRRPVGDECSFRYFYGYLDNCVRLEKSLSFFQPMLFLQEVGTTILLI